MSQEIHSAGKGTSTGRLRSGSIGAGHIVFFVVSAAAPLSGVVLGVPVIIGLGNGIGAAGAFVVVALVLLLFSVGYTAMSRQVVNAGGFYVFVAQGLGRVAGLGAATFALFSYTAIQAGMFGALGAYVNPLVVHYTGVDIPWWIYSLIGTALCWVLGVRQVSLGARVLGVMLVLESSLIVVLDVVIFATGGASGEGPAGLSWEPFDPKAVFAGAVGIGMVFAYTSFIGFEATVIYGEEAIEPRRTVPRATYVALITMGVFYAASTWLIINSFGIDAVVGIAAQDPGGFAERSISQTLGPAAVEIMKVLIVTSIFAAVLAFHNTLARYLFALGRQGLMWTHLGRTHHERQSPHIACTVQAVSAAVLIIVFAVAGAPPYTGLYVWATGIGAICIIVLQAVASVAVFAFFRRNSVDNRPWHTLIAPALSLLVLVSLTAVSLSNFSLLVGDPGPVAVTALAALPALAALAGAGRALWLRRKRPEQYEKIGQTGDPDATT
ncbi:APC family permease [Amycolatopsis sp. CA-126428]|uniref:APC family permease n=1 Tax=Amycolatopsis sp. CA-126428 TaxID=2073158 RepID=UPI000CD2B766|nr:APC family permease [Amycolatopsis sp. CA-126428]